MKKEILNYMTYYLLKFSNIFSNYISIIFELIIRTNYIIE